MLYIINGNIHFRNTDGALWKDDENDPSSVTLTATTNRLLTFLLERHGEVASREDILDKVWTSYGLRSSNNSLNKYIADLRKVFTNLEIPDEVIITVPRVGFMFTRDIDVERQPFNSEYSPLAEGVVAPGEDTVDNQIPVADLFPKKWVYVSLAIVVLGILPVMVSKLLINVKLSEINTLKQSSSFFLGKVNECEIFTIKQSSSEMTAVKLAIADKIISQTGLRCLENTRIFFQPSDPVVYGYPGRIFLSRCTFNKDTPTDFAACDNYYGVNYINE